MALTREGGIRKWERNFPGWVEKCTALHGGKYTYPTNVRVGSPPRWKIPIICPEHGEFLQSPEKHAFGRGCPKCVGVGTDKVAQLKEMFPNFKFQDDLEVTNTKTQLKLSCEIHGEFSSTYNTLHNRFKAGNAPCPKCNRKSGGLIRRRSAASWVSEIEKVYGGKVELDAASITTADEKARFVCKDHGEFFSVLADVAGGHGCFKCGNEKRNATNRGTFEDFYKQAREIHGDTYEYVGSTFFDSKQPMEIVCKKHGSFMQRPNNHLALKAGCPSCAISISKGEFDLRNWLIELGFNVDSRNRSLLNGRREIDIVLPDHNIGIEYCGLYWHGEDMKERLYHAQKYEEAGENGIKLITIFEDEWLEEASKEKVKNRILSIIGKGERIYARKTECRKITWSEARVFLDKHHTASAGAPAKVCYGLYFEGELVSVAAFSMSRFGGAEWELFRFCSLGTTKVVGGLSKMFSAFLKEYEPESVVSYADRRFGNGDVYGTIGFEYDGKTEPGYYWCKSSKRYSRFDFQKHKLKTVLVKFDGTLSESENCHNDGYWRIYDCGHSRWIWRKDQ